MKFRLLMLSLTLLGTGGWMLAPTLNSKEQVECKLGQLIGGDLPDSNWVKVDGRLVWDEAAIEERRGRIDAFFVPLVPRNWKKNQPVHVFVRVSKYEAEKLGENETIEGLIQPTGFPMDLRLIFESEGPQPAENVVYIHHGADPVSQGKFAKVILGIGSLGLIASVLMYVMTGKGTQETTVHSRSQARSRNEEDIKRSAEAEEKHLQQVAERTNEIDRWMRERGLKKDEPEAAEEQSETAEPSSVG